MRKLAIILFSAILLPLIFAIALPAKQEKRLALLIGNSNYQFSGKLPNPINDVRAIKIVLEQLGFAVLKYEDCSQTTMKRAIDKFGRQLKTKDVGLFFYAGHGVQVDGYNYLLPINAKLENENDAEYSCVRAGRILAKMESAGSRTNIVILDACRANPFERAWRRGEKGSGLAFMNAPSGSLIAYSTAPGRTALDGRGKNSPYTRALLQHINKPNITVLQMFQRVRSTVMRQSDKKQIPWESTSLRGDFYFKDGSGIGGKQSKKQFSLLGITFEELLYELDEDTYAQIVKEEREREVQIMKREAKIQTKAIELDTKNTTAYLTRGYAYYELKQYTKAIQDYTRAIDLDPKNVKGYWLRGETYRFGTEQYTKAIQDYTKAIQLNRYNEAYYILMEERYSYLKQYSRTVHRDYKKIIELKILLYPKNTWLYRFRARAYHNLEQNTKALQDYTKVVELNPLDGASYAERAYIYQELNQFTKSLQDYTKAIALDPTNIDFYYDRAELHEELKQYRKALKDYAKAIDLQPKELPLYYRRAGIYKDLKQYRRAIQEFTTIIELDPDSYTAYRERGDCYRKLGRIAEAVNDEGIVDEYDKARFGTPHKTQ